MEITFFKRGRAISIDIRHNDIRIRTSIKFKTNGDINGTTIKGDRNTSNKLATIKTGLEDLDFDYSKKRLQLTKDIIFIELLNLCNQKPIEEKKEVESKKDIWEYWDQWIDECQHKISPITKRPYARGTINHYRKVKNILQAFQVDEKFIVSIDTISSDDFYTKFTKHIIKKGQSVNTLSDHFKHVKTFCKWLQKRENINNDFRDFRRHSSYSDAEPLKEHELLKIYDAKFTGVMEKARLAFLLLCSTGMRVSDYNKIDSAQIVEGILIFRSQKTNGLCYVPYFDDLYFRPVYLYDKLCKNYEKTSIPAHRFNQYIAKISECLGIARIKPTSKTGRKTFATLKLLSGVAPEIIMKSTGHKTRTAFDAYVGIDTSDILKAYKDKAINMKVG